MHILLHCIVQLKILITFDDVISQLRFSILHSSFRCCSCLLMPRHFWKLLHHSFNSFLGLVLLLLGFIAQMQLTCMQPLVPDHHCFCIPIVLHCFLGTAPTALCKLVTVFASVFIHHCLKVDIMGKVHHVFLVSANKFTFAA